MSKKPTDHWIPIAGDWTFNGAAATFAFQQDGTLSRDSLAGSDKAGVALRSKGQVQGGDLSVQVRLPKNETDDTDGPAGRLLLGLPRRSHE